MKNKQWFYGFKSKSYWKIGVICCNTGGRRGEAGGTHTTVYAEGKGLEKYFNPRYVTWVTNVPPKMTCMSSMQRTQERSEFN